jgi:hypothetical protein
MIETGLIGRSSGQLSSPQGLKPEFILALNGTAEAVPYPKPVDQTISTQGRAR